LGLVLPRVQPQVLALLRRTRLRDLMDPVPQPLLSPNNTLGDISKAVVTYGNEFFYVSSDGTALEGVVTMTDLLRGHSTGAAASTAVTEFMTRNPVALAADDDCALASAAMREYRLKSLPVVDRKDSRKLVGCLRLRTLMAFIFKETGGP
jgi:CBS domain-containing protein